jgi:4-alpha-glucanotransferase
MVIGEDLGTVPVELRETLARAGLLSYRPLIFEKDAAGEFAPPTAYPRNALACVSTHDLPTWRGFWAARDLELREESGLSADLRAERARRKEDQERLAHALAREGLDTSAAGAHAFIARTPCKFVMVQPEDVLEGRGRPVTAKAFSTSGTGMYVPSDQLISPVARCVWPASFESVT